MKNLILLCFIRFTTNFIAAQSINLDWFYEEGETTIKLIADNPEFFDDPIGGIAMTWDFSEALTFSMDTLTEIYLSPDSLTNGVLFPLADIAKTVNGFEFYYEFRDEGIYQIGFDAIQQIIQFSTIGSPVGFVYGLNEPRETLYDLITINNISGDTTAQNDILNISELIGIGTVITPEGKYENCVLQKNSTMSNGFVSSESFNFFKDKFSNQIATFSKTAVTIPNEFTKSFTYQTDIEELLSTVEKNPLFEWKLYSHSNQIHIISNKNYQSVDLMLLNSSGDLLNKFHQNIIRGENVIKVKDNVPLGQFYLLSVIFRNILKLAELPEIIDIIDKIHNRVIQANNFL